MKKYKNIINNAKVGKYAIPQFNINNLENAKYILEVCQTLNSPVFIGVSKSAANYMGGYVTIRKMIDGLKEDLNITIPVILHLDHGPSLEECKKAYDAGFDSIMIDASKLPIEENINVTNEVIAYCQNALIEGEIGAISTQNNEIIFTTLEDVQKYTMACNVDLIAPALGSVHGLYKENPNINFKEMAKINAYVKTPMVLHGGTGIDDETLHKCIENGIIKININTEIQIAWYNSIKNYIAENNNIYDPRKVNGSSEDAIKKILEHKITILNSLNKGM